MLIPNPFYAAYAAGALAADCEPVYLPATRASGFLPDLDALDDALLEAHRRLLSGLAVEPARRGRRRAPISTDWPRCRAATAFWCSPTNAIARSTASINRPACWKRPAPAFTNTVVFHSLSKRSNLPGLRVGFAAGDKNFLAAFLELRNVAAPQVPGPAQHVAVAAYNDEAHVEKNRELYSAKFDLADQIIGGRYGYERPAGGFFLWLDVSAFGGSEIVTKRLWAEAGVRVVPGRYLAREQADGTNPGADYIRVAMVQDSADHGRSAASHRRGFGITE